LRWINRSYLAIEQADYGEKSCHPPNNDYLTIKKAVTLNHHSLFK